MTGWRKVIVFFGGLGALLLLAHMDLSAEKTSAIAEDVVWLAAAYMGGNGMEHMAKRFGISVGTTSPTTVGVTVNQPPAGGA